MSVRVIKPEQVYDGDLGGCAMSPVGDPQSWVPSVWSGMLEAWAPDDGLRRIGVLDLGCGLGYSARWFRDHGANVTAVDGSPVVASFAVVPLEVHDFTTGPLPGICTWDLCWCSEFVEHVAEEHLPNILDAFRRCRRVALTHAVPGQTGHHHVNCQFSGYWIARLADVGLRYDVSMTNWLRAVANDAHPHSYFSWTGLVFERRD